MRPWVKACRDYRGYLARLSPATRGLRLELLLIAGDDRRIFASCDSTDDVLIRLLACDPRFRRDTKKRIGELEDVGLLVRQGEWICLPMAPHEKEVLSSGPTKPRQSLDTASTVPRQSLDTASTVPRQSLDSRSTLPRQSPDTESGLSMRNHVAENDKIESKIESKREKKREKKRVPGESSGPPPDTPELALVCPESSKERSPPKVPPTGAIWDAYAEAYAARYGVDPKRNRTVNGQLAHVLQRLGAEEAPEVARFFVRHNRRVYVEACHPVGLLLRDAEALRTQWVTGRRVTRGDAAAAERVDELRAQSARVEAMLRAEGIDP